MTLKFAKRAALIVWEHENEFMDYNIITEFIRARFPGDVIGARTLHTWVRRDISKSGMFEQRTPNKPYWRLNGNGLEFAKRNFFTNIQEMANTRLTKHKIDLVEPGSHIGSSNSIDIAEPISRQSHSKSMAYDREPAEPTPKAVDLAEPPKRARATINRICRDTVRARRVKQLHEYRCQIRGCRHRIKLPNGLFYAEAHHVQPLGRDHKGLDVEANILCVCPNHHAKLDLGAINISLTDLREVDGHAIAKKYIDYHNNVIMKRWLSPRD